MQSSSGTVKRACPLSFLSAALPAARQNYLLIVFASFVHEDLYPIYPIMRNPDRIFARSIPRVLSNLAAAFQRGCVL